MVKKVFIALFISVLSSVVYAQEKEIDTVYVFDKQMNHVKSNHVVQKISNQDILKNSTNLSEVLRFQSEVYIKENGRGMTSSPSFRGTTAQQTAFIWNGVNLNSMFLGQGDINNLSLLSYDDIDVVAGGGSLIYGSGAIGGSIHLNNHLKYNKGTNANLYFEGASFSTYHTALKANHSDEKWSFSVGANHSISENDYEIPEKKYKNRNGKFSNLGVNFGLGYRLNAKNQFSTLYHWDSGSQNFPIFEETQTKTKYKSRHQRLLSAWDYKNERIANTLQFAYLNEEFDYFSDINKPRVSGGVGNTFLLKNDAKVKLNSVLGLNILGQYSYQNGEGYQSGIQKPTRKSGFLTSILRYQPNSKFSLHAGVRKEFNNLENAPFVYSLSAKYQPVKWYNLLVDFSKNYRAPTFNDLYWNPGGNLDLKSETAHQMSQDHLFMYRDFNFRVSPYYMKIKNMIRWLPTASGYWSPINTNEVASYGLASEVNWQKKWRSWESTFGMGYTFTRSINLDTKKQLSYVPTHKMNLHSSLRYKKYSMYAQALFNGLTFTETNENSKTALEEYLVLNLGVSAKINRYFSVGTKINNVTNSIYETKAYFPLPKRNYALYLTLKY